MTQQPPAMPPPGYAPPPSGPPPGYGPPGYGQPGYAGRPGYGPVPGYPAPPPVSPSGQPLASFGDRLLAYLIDSAILGGTLLVIAIPAVVVYLTTADWDALVVVDRGDPVREPDPFGFLVSLLLLEAALVVVGFVLQYLYQVEMPRRTGQTVGKRVMKIRIIPLDPAGSIGRAPLARRYLVQVGSALLPGLAYLDGLWQLWDKPYQQCLHDKFARTVVVKVPA